MNEVLPLVLALATGLVLGAIFFGGLWWTVQKGMTSDWSALWFCGSWLLRTVLVVTGFLLIARGHWERLLVCLVGFVVARMIVMRQVRAAAKQGELSRETCHAS